MIHLLYLFIFIKIICIWLYYKFAPTTKIIKIQTENVYDKCQVPTLDSWQCYLSKYNECPIKNGSYLQCTNNYIPKPSTNNCNCDNRTFDMCPYPYKLSENCYYHNKYPNYRKQFE